MIKRLVALCYVMLACTLFTSCEVDSNPGIIDNVVIEIGASSKFTEAEIQNAIDRVLAEFKHFDGCDLTRLWYDEDVSNKLLKSEDNLNQIILLSDFNTDETAGNEGFNTNSSYTNWTWKLVRRGLRSKWRLEDWGYG